MSPRAPILLSTLNRLRMMHDACIASDLGHFLDELNVRRTSSQSAQPHAYVRVSRGLRGSAAVNLYRPENITIRRSSLWVPITRPTLLCAGEVLAKGDATSPVCLKLFSFLSFFSFPRLSDFRQQDRSCDCRGHRTAADFGLPALPVYPDGSKRWSRRRIALERFKCQRKERGVIRTCSGCRRPNMRLDLDKRSPCAADSLTMAVWDRIRHRRGRPGGVDSANG
ncbi:hypothetical protein LZ30DRAFT_300223 [Colletotrichum cereale]|nr:hypothetical protein LZ30DRAFT_300223 [Colletotrichum cereale]